ncbi:MAG: hypothetical protein ACXAEF_13310, partial [Candidatus Thorarchaeota archaeon]
MKRGLVGEKALISIVISDNIEVSRVCAIYWFETSDINNVTMVDNLDGTWELTVDILNYLVPLKYQISFKDTSNNWNESEVMTIDVIDETPPVVVRSGFAAQPTTGDTILFNATLVDNIEMESAFLIYRSDNGPWTNLSLIRNGPEIWYENIPVGS